MAVPTDIAGLRLWTKGDGTFWQNSARTTPVATNADPVGSWDDASGLGTHATQPTSGSRPTWRTGELNGLPVVRFDGSDDRLDFTLGAPTNYAMFAVFKWVPNANQQAILAFRKTLVGIAGSGTVQWWADTDVGQKFSSLACVAGWNYLVLDQTGTTYTIRLNGALAGTGANNALDTASGINRIGMFSIWPWASDIAEVGLYDAAFSSGDRTALEGYIVQKWFTSAPPLTLITSWW